MGRAFGPYIPPVNELFADHRLPRQGKRRRHTNEHLSFVSLSLHNAERHRAPLPLAALFKSNSGRFENRCVAFNKAAKAAGRDSIWQGNCECDSSQAFDIHYGARMSRALTLRNRFNTHKSNCPAKSRGGSVQ
jgi:hypothetical protein